MTGHMIAQCNARRKGIKPCQSYINYGKRIFGEGYRWDYGRKSGDSKGAKAVAVIEEGCEMRKEEESKEVSVIAASTTKGK